MKTMQRIVILGLLLLVSGSAFAQESVSVLPKKRRIDRQINAPENVFGYKGEFMLGLTASYGTISSEDSDFMVYLANVNVDGALTTVKPFFGYFYRDNRCIGLRLGYQYMDGNLGNLDLDLGEQNDITLNVSGMEMRSDNYSVAIFHRAYVAIDPKGQFGLFAEIEGAAQMGTSEFVNNAGNTMRYTKSENLKLKIGFNPGVAVYIFPSVCATVSVGLGGVQYTQVEQFDEAGNPTGQRRAAKMRFRLNIADIHFGMNIHLWDKKKMARRY
ncbi:MAG: hypothetical protein IJ502_04760 [Alistipes sp.]|nr:hypothetical protein [Alistipes sp.]